MRPIVRAVMALRWVLRNSLAGSASAWLFAETIASGTWIVTGRRPDRQSRDEFHAAGAFWYAFIYSLFLQAIGVIRLFPVIQVDEKAPLASVRKIGRILLLLALRGAWVHIGFGVGCNVLAYLYVKQSRLMIYPSSVTMIHISAAMNAITSNLYTAKTTQAKALAVDRAQPSRTEVKVPARSTFFNSLGRAWRKSLPLLFITLFAIGYVHVTASIMLDSPNLDDGDSKISSATRSVLFVIGSVILKFALQEFAKRVLLMRPGLPKQGQAMMLIATPTLFVDIQVRVVLLQYSNMTTTFAVGGSLGLAAIEIISRFAKMLFVRWEALGNSGRRRRKSKSIRPSIRQISILGDLGNSTASKIFTPSPSSANVEEANQQNAAPAGQSVSDSSRLQSMHAKRILVIHACETYADMYAEYLALGCSYAVLVVFSKNPHFNLYYSSGSASSTSYWALFGLQIVIEVAVDAVSSAIEVALGLEVESISQHTWTAASYMVLLAFVNVGLCGGLYQSG